jgi:hypothetical protein
MATLPKGLDVEDCIEIHVTSLEYRAEPGAALDSGGS